MAEYIIVYQVEGTSHSYLTKSKFIAGEIDKLVSMWEPREVVIRYILRVGQYSTGFNIKMFKRGSWEDLLK